MADEDPPVRLLSATPVLKAGDYPRARRFYVDRLGFRVNEEGGDPPRFGILERDGAVIFVDAWHGPPAPVAGAWDAYIHVSDVDALYREWREAAIPLSRALEDTVYGMREFEVTDPDGNVLCFGADSPP